jgi:hypothetical protein
MSSPLYVVSDKDRPPVMELVRHLWYTLDGILHSLRVLLYDDWRVPFVVQNIQWRIMDHNSIKRNSTYNNSVLKMIAVFFWT